MFKGAEEVCKKRLYIQWSSLENKDARFGVFKQCVPFVMQCKWPSMSFLGQVTSTIRTRDLAPKAQVLPRRHHHARGRGGTSMGQCISEGGVPPQGVAHQWGVAHLLGVACQWGWHTSGGWHIPGMLTLVLLG